MLPALPRRAGVGFKPEHFDAIVASHPDLGFFEIHAENYMGAGGPPHRRLAAIRADHALSIHGVGLSIGHPGPLDAGHLDRLAALVDRYEPESFSEHLAWSSHGGHLADLLPLPLTEATLAIVIDHVDAVQSRLKRRMLLENPSTYVRFSESTIPETEFLGAVIAATGCGLLLDVANVMVSAVNHGFDPRAYVAALPLAHVGEIHLAGRFETVDAAGLPLFVDAHDRPVPDDVWALYAEVIARIGPTPTLIEWDADLPPFKGLLAEARRAEAILASHREARHVAA
ncbi:MAG: DUF692 domain-containing protein [Hyphomicrobiales bacterium]|nr:DUF692 domain-containing protein [Hyphomicrobiales bacterium]